MLHDLQSVLRASAGHKMNAEAMAQLRASVPDLGSAQVQVGTRCIPSSPDGYDMKDFRCKIGRCARPVLNVFVPVRGQWRVQCIWCWHPCCQAVHGDVCISRAWRMVRYKDTGMHKFQNDIPLESLKGDRQLPWKLWGRDLAQDVRYAQLRLLHVGGREGVHVPRLADFLG